MAVRHRATRLSTRQTHLTLKSLERKTPVLCCFVSLAFNALLRDKKAGREITPCTLEAAKKNGELDLSELDSLRGSVED